MSRTGLVAGASSLGKVAKSKRNERKNKADDRPAIPNHGGDSLPDVDDEFHDDLNN